MFEELSQKAASTQHVAKDPRDTELDHLLTPLQQIKHFKYINHFISPICLRLLGS